MTERKQDSEATKADSAAEKAPKPTDESQPKEVGGRTGPEPTRYGDWEKNGIISDF